LALEYYSVQHSSRQFIHTARCHEVLAGMDDYLHCQCCTVQCGKPLVLVGPNMAHLVKVRLDVASTVFGTIGFSVFPIPRNYLMLESKTALDISSAMSYVL